MIKILLAFATFFAFSACSQIEVNATMCDQIASDPTAPKIPQECRDYNEEEADKAFNKVIEEKKVSDKDIEFSREK
ncbi:MULTISPECIES: hypothetical protein [Sulfurimonas]|uniref:hypothetical protein n=1 Tax=Sulfurimonas TaxID=202746 RepID=UPI00126447A7|nr:hypothetical protein [Sulfurimonas indica]